MAKNHYTKPLCEALEQYINQNTIPFHTPGHKQGRTMDSGLLDVFCSSMLQKDLTEVNGLDNLHQPESSIKKTQELVADIMNVEESWLLIGGRTAACYAALSSVLSPGDAFFADRQIGIDVWRASILGGFIPIFLPGKTMHDGSVFQAVTERHLLSAIQKHPEGKAVFLSTTTESGIVCDLDTIGEACQAHNLILIADDLVAPFSRVFPKRLQSGRQTAVDLSIQTKISFPGFPAQGGFLHRGTERVSSDRIRSALQIIQSTSPSYIIMGALDKMRYDLWQCATERVKDAIQITEYVVERYKAEPRRCGTFIDEMSDMETDSIRKTICFPGKLKRREKKVHYLVYGSNYLIYAPGLGPSRVDPREVLEEILSVELCPAKDTNYASEISLETHQIDPTKISGKHKTKVRLSDARNKVLASPYKIPETTGGYLYPGEILTDDLIDNYFRYCTDSNRPIEILVEV